MLILYVINLKYLNEDIVINRITGDPHEEDLIEPFWLQKKGALAPCKKNKLRN